MRCVHEDCLKRAPHRHHVVYEQELRRRWKSGQVDMARWPTKKRLLEDCRNLIDMCQPHHFAHHDGATGRILTTMLPDEALEFAFELLGPYAYDYIKRHYEGADPRLESLLAAAA